MAEERDPEVAEFMRWVMAQRGFTRPTDLVRALVNEGVIGPTEVRNVYRWLNGENAPEHKTTMALLRFAGLFQAA